MPDVLTKPFPGKQGRIENKDNTFSTERTITFDIDGKFYVVPSLVFDNGPQQLTFEQAIQRAIELGLEKFPSFDTLEKSEVFAKARSKAKGVMNMPAVQSQQSSQLQAILSDIEQRKRSISSGGPKGLTQIEQTTGAIQGLIGQLNLAFGGDPALTQNVSNSLGQRRDNRLREESLKQKMLIEKLDALTGLDIDSVRIQGFAESNLTQVQRTRSETARAGGLESDTRVKKEIEQSRIDLSKSNAQKAYNQAQLAVDKLQFSREDRPGEVRDARVKSERLLNDLVTSKLRAEIAEIEVRGNRIEAAMLGQAVNDLGDNPTPAQLGAFEAKFTSLKQDQFSPFEAILDSNMELKLAYEKAGEKLDVLIRNPFHRDLVTIGDQLIRGEMTSETFGVNRQILNFAYNKSSTDVIERNQKGKNIDATDSVDFSIPWEQYVKKDKQAEFVTGLMTDLITDTEVMKFVLTDENSTEQISKIILQLLDRPGEELPSEISDLVTNMLGMLGKLKGQQATSNLTDQISQLSQDVNVVGDPEAVRPQGIFELLSKFEERTQESDEILGVNRFTPDQQKRIKSERLRIKTGNIRGFGSGSQKGFGNQ